MRALLASLFLICSGVHAQPLQTHHTPAFDAHLLDFSREEIARILQHGPWPPPLRPDPSNRVSGKPEAIALGEQLFFEPRLSGTGSVLCATCHAPYRYFQDARPRAFGLELVDRNTPTLIDSRFHRRFGWDGAQDSLWAQSIRPLLEPREMSASAAHVAQTVRTLFLKPYEVAFGHAPSNDDEEVLADVGKALAAYQETLVSARTSFDDFRDALEKGQRETAYPLPAQRGLRIFVGKGNCSVCHSGPRFTNGEGGIEKLKRSPFNLRGRYNDDDSGATAAATRQVEVGRRDLGQFRVPGLRGVAQTAPYMHNGSLATLADVVKLHGERTRKPLHLTARESADLLAFLESLSAPGMSRMDQRAP